ncbi:MAG: hypothetical protein CVU27_03515 [Betaproteobacteria bacterium HGW-Betaproteobacteria-20]|jgi:hypothetical protein|nr:MAG: hypothetical protein CVU27_03515 [Betaproteobacteria bacterium HGW-Betaproteobacteria-20]
MTVNFFRSIKEPNRKGLTWEELWKGFDKGLIACWERGREKSLENPELSRLCKNGELPVLAWKGGVDKKIKGKKYGSLFYLATWQGLRGEDLNINQCQDTTIICTKTEVEVIFTPNLLTYETSKSEELES